MIISRSKANDIFHRDAKHASRFSVAEIITFFPSPFFPLNINRWLHTIENVKQLEANIPLTLLLAMDITEENYRDINVKQPYAAYGYPWQYTIMSYTSRTFTVIITAWNLKLFNDTRIM